jgi:5-methylcytosine-specific restriction enzyme A
LAETRIAEVDFARMPPSYETSAFEVMECLGEPFDDERSVCMLPGHALDFLDSAPWPQVRDELDRAWLEVKRQWAHREFFNRFGVEAASEKVEAHNRRDVRGGTLTERQWHALRVAFESRCAYCGEGTSGVLEHVVPICRGGRTSIDNVLPSCWGCNRDKGRLELHEWHREPWWWADFLERCVRAAPRYRRLARPKRKAG